MAPIAIVSALHDELSAVLALMPDSRQEIVGRRIYCRGHLHGQDVVAVLSGIGKVAAATTATALIERFGVRQVLFTGVAGGLAEGFETIAVFVAMCLLPESFPLIAYGFAALCALTTVIRWRQGWLAFSGEDR